MSDNKEILNITEIYDYDDEGLPYIADPICYQDIAKAQKNDAKLKKKQSHIKTIPSTLFVGGDKDHHLICQNNKICLPPALHKKTVDWYHEMLCHLGET